MAPVQMPVDYVERHIEDMPVNQTAFAAPTALVINNQRYMYLMPTAPVTLRRIHNDQIKVRRLADGTYGVNISAAVDMDGTSTRWALQDISGDGLISVEQVQVQ